MAPGPGWSRARISGVPLPELAINGVAIPADHCTWNGRDRFGNLVAPGGYPYRISVTDDSGNTAVATGTITVR